MKRQRHAIVALLVAVSLAVMGLTITPAAGHVASWAHNWNSHIKPRADYRYYTKARSNNRYQKRVMALSSKQSGLWATAGQPGGIALATVEFDASLPGGVYARWLAQGQRTHRCPGPGRAALGTLCVYTDLTVGMRFENIWLGSLPAKGYHLALEPTQNRAYASGSRTVRARRQ